MLEVGHYRHVDYMFPFIVAFLDQTCGVRLHIACYQKIEQQNFELDPGKIIEATRDTQRVQSVKICNFQFSGYGC